MHNFKEPEFSLQSPGALYMDKNTAIKKCTRTKLVFRMTHAVILPLTYMSSQATSWVDGKYYGSQESPETMKWVALQNLFSDGGERKKLVTTPFIHFGMRSPSTHVRIWV
jgi:hypothetical protein